MSAAQTLVSVEQYLQLSAKPAYEYLDGELRQKPMPAFLHSYVQRMLILVLGRLGFIALPELTVPVTATRFLVPDVAIVEPMETDYPTKPALLCVEILSPRDRLGAALAKSEEYHAWGVPYCWVIDPVKQTAGTYHAQEDPLKIERGGTLPAGQIAVQLSELFPILNSL